MALPGQVPTVTTVEDPPLQTSPDLQQSPIPDNCTLSFRIKKYGLIPLLDKAGAIIPAKPILPVLKNFRITATGSSLTIAATDLDQSLITTSTLVSIDKSGTALIPAKRLIDCVREAPDGELTITVVNGEAHITADRTSWNLKLMVGQDYPHLPDPKHTTWNEINRTKFIGWIRSVRHAAATDAVRPSLMVVNVKNGRIRASDGVRFAQTEVGSGIPIEMSIPIRAVDDLLKILERSTEEQIHLGEDEDSLFFRAGVDIFITQKLNSTFPDVDVLLLKPTLTNDQQLRVNRTDFLKAIKRVRITADPDTSAVILYLTHNEMRVCSKDKYGSTAEEIVDTLWNSPDREVAFNHTHLVAMLSNSTQETCNFYFGKDTRNRPLPIVLKDENGSIGVLNALRLSWLQ